MACATLAVTRNGGPPIDLDALLGPYLAPIVVGLAVVSIVLFLIGLYFHQFFHDTHVYVAQALVVCVAVALWLYWATRFADAPAH